MASSAQMQTHLVNRVHQLLQSIVEAGARTGQSLHHVFGQCISVCNALSGEFDLGKSIEGDEHHQVPHVPVGRLLHHA